MKMFITIVLICVCFLVWEGCGGGFFNSQTGPSWCERELDVCKIDLQVERKKNESKKETAR